MYVTYPDLVQVGIFVIALVGLCHAIFGEENSRQLLPIVNG